MRLATLYRTIATVCVLVAEKGVRGDDDDDNDSNTVTVTATTAQTLTTTSVRVEATTVAVPNTTPSLPPPAIPTPAPALPPAPPSQQSPTEGNDGNSTMQAVDPPAEAENPSSGGQMTPERGQGASAPEPDSNSSAQVGTPSAAAQMEAPSASQAANLAPTVAAVQGPGMGMEIDPATGDLLGGNPPSRNVDLPITIVFLFLFLLGAFTHISIYRANAKRGHKFLLSDLMFDFCMIRSVTCIFRIIWVFSQLRGIVLAAQIFFNGGAAVVFVVNIFFAQRIVRSMHPIVGWSKPFSLGTTILAISVPPVIILQIVSISVFFLSTDNPDRAETAEGLLKFGSSWNIWLVSFPFLTIFISCSIPGPKPEKFGSGSLRVKTSLAMLGAALLATGATVRTFGTFNPRPKDSGDVLYSKAVFYVTQFSFEIIVVALYAFARIDLLFHVPNGSSQPGDYSANKAGDTENAVVLSRGEIRDKIEETGLHHQILKPSYTSPFMQTGMEPVFAVFYPSAPDAASLVGMAQDMVSEGKLPPRPVDRISRRKSVVEAFRSTSSISRRPPQGAFGLPSQPRPPRPPRSTQSMYRTSPDEPSDAPVDAQKI